MRPPRVTSGSITNSKRESGRSLISPLTSVTSSPAPVVNDSMEITENDECERASNRVSLLLVAWHPKPHYISTAIFVTTVEDSFSAALTVHG